MTFARELLPSWETYAKQVGMMLRGTGNERRAVCGIHGGERDSLTMNLAGPWQCKACGEAGSDVLAYHQALHGLRFVDAARDLGAWADVDKDEEGKSTATRRPRSAPPRQEPQVDDEQQRRRRDQGAQLFEASRMIEPGTPAAQYLYEARKCARLHADADLRWHPEVRIFGLSGSALVGRMSLAANAKVTTGAHVTLLRRDAGGWARGERRYLGQKKGAVVRLWPDEAVTTGLGIAEGIETALSLAHAFKPVWSTMDAGNMAALPVLEGIESLLIAADNDDAGIAAAQACGERWAAAGREARIVMPERHKSDLNDIAKGAAA